MTSMSINYASSCIKFESGEEDPETKAAAKGKF